MRLHLLAAAAPSSIRSPRPHPSAHRTLVHPLAAASSLGPFFGAGAGAGRRQEGVGVAGCETAAPAPRGAQARWSPPRPRTFGAAAAICSRQRARGRVAARWVARTALL
ncbi:unnamed protein product [Urochloa humidicola]